MNKIRDKCADNFPELSVIATLFCSEAYIEEFYERIKKSIDQLRVSYEIIFVDDGSPDNSLARAIGLTKIDKQVKVIELSRNFGHHYAIHAGLKYCRGDLIFLIDSDLETRPETLVAFYSRLAETELDVVYGMQQKRKGGIIESILGGIFWKSLSVMAATEIPQNILTVRLMNKRYVDGLLKLGDQNLFLGGMFHWAGFKQEGIFLEVSQRKGLSTYSFFKRFNLMVQAITSFTSVPLYYIFFSGLIISTLSVFYGSFMLFQKLFYPELVLSGFTSIIVAITFFSGFIIVCLGLIGLYLSKVFNQTQNRPLYLIRNIYD
jgi:putative glycosyltransferase